MLSRPHPYHSPSRGRKIWFEPRKAHFQRSRDREDDYLVYLNQLNRERYRNGVVKGSQTDCGGGKL